MITKKYKNIFGVYVSNEKCERTTKDIEESISEYLWNKIINAIPWFIYYEEYGNFDSNLFLPRVIEDLDRIDELSGKERMRARTLKVLFSHLKLNAQEILDLGQEHDESQIEEDLRNKKDREAKVSSAASYLSIYRI